MVDKIRADRRAVGRLRDAGQALDTGEVVQLRKASGTPAQQRARTAAPSPLILLKALILLSLYGLTEGEGAPFNRSSLQGINGGDGDRFRPILFVEYYARSHCSSNDSKNRRIMMSVLISEVAGAGRWSQFNLKLNWVPAFFGQAAENIDTVQLCSLNGAGQVTYQYTQHAMYKPASSNWAFEIPGAAELAFPGKNNRPILVLSQRPDGQIPFELVMPGDAPYAAVSAFLAANRQTPASHLARCIVDDATLPVGKFGLHI